MEELGEPNIYTTLVFYLIWYKWFIPSIFNEINLLIDMTYIHYLPRHIVQQYDTKYDLLTTFPYRIRTF